MLKCSGQGRNDNINGKIYAGIVTGSKKVAQNEENDEETEVKLYQKGL